MTFITSRSILCVLVANAMCATGYGVADTKPLLETSEHFVTSVTTAEAAVDL